MTQREVGVVVIACVVWSTMSQGLGHGVDQRIIATSVPRYVGHTLLLNGRTYSPPYVISAIGDAAAMQEALSAAPMVTLYKRYAARFGLGYTEDPGQVELVGHGQAVRMKFAQPVGPLGY